MVLLSNLSLTEWSKSINCGPNRFDPPNQIHTPRQGGSAFGFRVNGRGGNGCGFNLRHRNDTVFDCSDLLEPSSHLFAPRLRYCSVPQALHYLYVNVNRRWQMLRYKEKRWDTKRMLDSGGMPSSHSATVTALAVTIALQDGTSGSAFAIAVVLACVVMYDASGVRLHAGRQAELLNQIVCELPEEHPLSNIRPLRDSLGHTPLQVVAGAVLGCIVAYLTKGS
ncbi:hypothetical protein FNV43_RR13120 [Rhamnella rubrinervis]|uniref:Acid phosphatase/vanadium-dependent haloperoxidase-related protein n=1 Tax=Rhamnella rubrinervis TaxID=2594499 RepID=A0A8K0MEW4_9ROSA|nr:hypothetical protein FNV43_RR13120 [Rhamnella rubrinervis]